MNVAILPEILSSAERVSHLAAALRCLLKLPQSAAALPALARIAGVIQAEATVTAETLADVLETDARTPETGLSTK